jgi:S-(hydroxymethyl)glutathione dehydrogenase/alcohol dehydrogenase
MMMMRFQAAVLHEIGAPVTVETVEAGPLQPSDVLVRNVASGLCHTDLELIQGAVRSPKPVVLGHEGAGIVEAVGSRVTQVRVGDHVICAHNTNCGQCFYCDNGLLLLCETFSRESPRGFLMDGTSRLSLDGRLLHHSTMASSHAEYSVVPELAAVPVSKEIPLDRACLIACGVMTGVGAVTRVARVRAGCSVLVVGCGAVGLNVLQACRWAGADPIIGLDLSGRKLELAQRFGASHVVNAGREDAVGRVRALTSSRGADYVFEAAGTETGMQLSLEAARPGADVVLLGKVDPDRSVSFRWGSLMGEKRIVRSSYGGARPRQDFPWLARAYLEGRLMLDELINRRITLKEINDSLAEMARGDVEVERAELVRAVLVMGGDPGRRRS